MIYNNVFTKTVLIVLFIFPNLVFATSTPFFPSEKDSFYLSFAYKYALSNFDNIIIANQHNYSKYKNSNLGTDVAFGHDIGNTRIEIASSYAKFDVEYHDDSYVKQAEMVSKRIDDVRTVVERRIPSVAVKVKDNGIRDISVMLNTYYDAIKIGMPIAPYIAVGVGLDFINAFEKRWYAFAYQGKIGIAYYLAPQVTIFAGSYYHGLFGNDVNEIRRSNNIIGQKLQMSFSYYGLEAGIKINLI